MTTIGQWNMNIAQHRGGFTIDADNNTQEICFTTSRAIAILIAAAPDLLEACDEALADWRYDPANLGKIEPTYIKKCRAALGKVRP